MSETRHLACEGARLGDFWELRALMWAEIFLLQNILVQPSHKGGRSVAKVY